MPGFCPNCLFPLPLRLQCTEANLLLAMYEANTLQKSRKYFQMCFMCIPVHTVGYRVQKFMTSIIILFMPLEEKKRITEVTSQCWLEHWENKKSHWKLMHQRKSYHSFPSTLDTPSPIFQQPRLHFRSTFPLKVAIQSISSNFTFIKILRTKKEK